MLGLLSAYRAAIRSFPNSEVTSPSIAEKKGAAFLLEVRPLPGARTRREVSFASPAAQSFRPGRFVIVPYRVRA